MYAITGATGNIGSKVAEILLAKGEKVRVIGRDGIVVVVEKENHHNS